MLAPGEVDVSTDDSSGADDSALDNAWPEGLRLDKNDKPVASTHNIFTIFTEDNNLKRVIRFDNFTKNIVIAENKIGISSGYFTDAAEAEISYYVSKKYDVEINSRVFKNALIAAARKYSFHKLQNILDKLRGTWDKQMRLNSWIKNTYLPKDDVSEEYLALIGKNFLIGAIARAMKPGCQMDSLLILEGAQGIGKSTSVKSLFYGLVNDTPLNIGDKDSVMALSGHWCVEIPELQGFSQTEDTKLKSFFATREDKIRLPYGRSVESFPRQNVFIGTTNQTEYFKDHTGNRRYWPVYCTTVNFKYIEENRDQLFAEALYRFEHGEVWWPSTASENDLLKVEQDKRMRIDPWLYLIEQFLCDRTFEWVQGNEIITDCIGKQPQVIQKADQMRVGAIMQALGWEKKVKRIPVDGFKRNQQKHVYVRPDDWNQRVNSG